MSNAAVRELVDLLRERGLVAADAAAPVADAVERPWFIALLQGGAGWLAGVFLLAFVGMVFEPNATAMILGIGFVLLAAAWAIYHLDREAVFLEQFALALSIAGQIAVAWAILEGNPSKLFAAVMLLLLQLVMWVVMPNTLARTLAAWFATIAWLYATRFLLDFAGEPSAWIALDWLLRWGPLLALAGWLIRRETNWMASDLRQYARPGLTGVLLGLAVGGFALDPFGWLVPRGETLGAALGWRALVPLLSIGLALCAAYGAFRVRSRGLLGLAVVAAIAHLARFYYLYGTTLLVKSLIMACVGAALLALGLWLRETRGAAP